MEKYVSYMQILCLFVEETQVTMDLGMEQEFL